jgi:hypothetical protein
MTVRLELSQEECMLLAMQCVVNEMFKNGQEEGLQIWNDPNHPLQQAIQCLLRVKAELFASTAEAEVLRELISKGEPPASFFTKPR